MSHSAVFTLPIHRAGRRLSEFAAVLMRGSRCRRWCGRVAEHQRTVTPSEAGWTSLPVYIPQRSSVITDTGGQRTPPPPPPLHLLFARTSITRQYNFFGGDKWTHLCAHESASSFLPKIAEMYYNIIDLHINEFIIGYTRENKPPNNK